MSNVAVIAAGPYSVLVRPRPAIVCGLLLAALIVAVVAALSLGANSVSLPRIVAALGGHGTPAETLIVAQLRLPRILTGALVGCALGAAGAIFQSLTRNPLGSPDVIGFDTGASTGGLVAMLLFKGGVLVTALGAVAGGMLTALAVFVLALRHGVAPLRLVLVGIGMASALAAVNSLLIVRSQLYDAQSAAVWLVGNLAGRDWSRLAQVAPVVAAGLLLALLLARPLTLAEFDDDRSVALGLRPNLMRGLAIAVGVLLAAIAVATAGPITFIALSAPQIVRRLSGAAGPNLVGSALCGAVLLVFADLAAREAFQPRQLPVGVLTGLIGGAYLAWLLGREWRKGHA